MRRITQLATTWMLVLLGCAGTPSGPQQLPGTIIGPAGGDFSFLDGAIVLHVAPGALTQDIGVSAVAATPPLDPAAIRGLGYTLIPSSDVQFPGGCAPGGGPLEYRSASAPVARPLGAIAAAQYCPGPGRSQHRVPISRGVG